MIAFTVYALIITCLIYLNGFFGLFKDLHLSKKILCAAFVLKILAVPAFYLFFKIYYGGIAKLDAGKFYADAMVMNDLAFINFPEYLKMLFGVQDDSPGSYFFKTCINTSNNWDNGPVKDFLYNDNRVVIRIHSLLHFISFRSYFVHALFSCFLSYIGLFFIYKSLKDYFPGREVLLFVLICFFPTLWLYTGGLLKEGLTIFFLGLLLFYLKKFFSLQRTIPSFIFLLFLIYISIFLKPYILFYAVILFSLFFLVQNSTIKFKAAFFLISIIGLTILINFLSVGLKDRSLIQAAQKREHEFMDLSTGGIFLLDSVKFVRVPYDTSLVKRAKDKPEHYTIKKNARFTYWEHTHQQDTLLCKANADTSTVYSLVYILPKAGSAINVIQGSNNFFLISLRSLYYTVLYPFFVNANGLMQQFASLENFFLLACLLIIITGLLIPGKEKFPGIVLLFFGLSLFLLIGFTTPNSGAIMRYRAPGAIFIIMSALYFFDTLRSAFRKIAN